MYRSKTAFWAGLVTVTLGVLLHLPMYFKANEVGYHLASMAMDLPMMIGMVLVVAGFFVSLYGLVPSPATERSTYQLRVQALDDASLSWPHVQLILIMVAAVTIDVMKPTTLSFVLPGMAREYGLRSPLNPAGTLPAALLPLSGISGTVLGSFIWGWLGDRIGRRASIIMAGVSFIATSACGSMPTFAMNVFMCFVMGLGVGGMLPIIFTLVAETIPARHRGWLMVLIGGDVAGAYIISSSLASALVPTYSWRILWLIGLPTGLLLVVLSHWIPESPRYLLAKGRMREAQDVLKRYGAAVIRVDTSRMKVERHVEDRFWQLFRAPFHRITATVVLLAAGVGLVSFGFQLWIPSNLQKLGFSEAEASALLRDSALIGFPFNLLVAWMYGFWSSKKTLILLSALTALALFGFAVTGSAVVHNRPLLYGLMIMPIWGISSVTAVLSAYAVEIYPTRIRSRGSGLVAGFSKAGGVLIIGLVTVAVAPPSIAGTALLGAIPVALGALAMAVFGIETRERSLEEITEEEIDRLTVATNDA